MPPAQRTPDEIFSPAQREVIERLYPTESMNRVIRALKDMPDGTGIGVGWETLTRAVKTWGLTRLEGKDRPYQVVEKEAKPWTFDNVVAPRPSPPKPVFNAPARPAWLGRADLRWKRWTCQWVCDEAAAKRGEGLCGAEALEGRAWCEFHFSRVYKVESVARGDEV